MNAFIVFLAGFVTGPVAVFLLFSYLSYRASLYDYSGNLKSDYLNPDGSYKAEVKAKIAKRYGFIDDRGNYVKGDGAS